MKNTTTTTIHALIRDRKDYYNSLLYDLPAKSAGNYSVFRMQLLNISYRSNIS